MELPNRLLLNAFEDDAVFVEVILVVVVFVDVVERVIGLVGKEDLLNVSTLVQNHE